MPAAHIEVGAVKCDIADGFSASKSSVQVEGAAMLDGIL
jgi:hypothetical protein